MKRQPKNIHRVFAFRENIIITKKEREMKRHRLVHARGVRLLLTHFRSSVACSGGSHQGTKFPVLSAIADFIFYVGIVRIPRGVFPGMKLLSTLLLILLFKTQTATLVACNRLRGPPEKMT